MNSRHKKLLLLFVYYAISFGIALFLIDYFSSGVRPGLKYIVGAVFFGFAMIFFDLMFKDAIETSLSIEEVKSRLRKIDYEEIKSFANGVHILEKQEGQSLLKRKHLFVKMENGKIVVSGYKAQIKLARSVI